MSNAYTFWPEDSDEFWVDVDYVARRITVNGELDIATVQAMVDAADALQGAAGDITIDLEAVTFIDAGAFGALVRLSAQQHSRQVGLHVIGNANLARVAELCGLASLMGYDRPATHLTTCQLGP